LSAAQNREVPLDDESSPYLGIDASLAFAAFVLRLEDRRGPLSETCHGPAGSGGVYLDGVLGVGIPTRGTASDSHNMEVVARLCGLCEGWNMR